MLTPKPEAWLLYQHIRQHKNRADFKILNIINKANSSICTLTSYLCCNYLLIDL